jgi:hypothetical protein
MARFVKECREWPQKQREGTGSRHESHSRPNRKIRQPDETADCPSLLTLRREIGLTPTFGSILDKRR